METHAWETANIYIIYATLVSHDKESSHDKRRAWSLDIKEDIEEDEWVTACLKAQSQTINTQMKLLQHKWLKWLRNLINGPLSFQCVYMCEMFD